MNQLPQADGAFATADDGTALQPSADSQPPPIASGVPAVPSSWKLAHPLTWRVFNCYCGRPVFFRNTQCLNCARPLGYEPEKAQLVALEAAHALSGQFCIAGEPGGWLYRRCANFETAARCNWLIPVTDGQNNTLCRCCRLNRIVPEQGIEANQKWWRLVEIAKRRLVSSLIALGLPVASRVSEDPVGGLAFDLLVALPGAVPVMTGHEDGIITLNVNEADDSTREAARSAMREPYRTVLGHLRHESGHYYWSRLLETSPWLEPYRALFGDERENYGAALARHHTQGPPPDWAGSFVSAYASAHPWEDWAETWAHYLHMLDTLDTALSAGIDSGRVELLQDPFDEAALYTGWTPVQGEPDRNFLAFVNAWVELTSVLNELSRSMGLRDFYPFVLSNRAVTKLHFVHRFVMEHRRAIQGPAAFESVAGEEDPGAALDTPADPQPGADADTPA